VYAEGVMGPKALPGVLEGCEGCVRSVCEVCGVCVRGVCEV
jgi:hypothetical protein